MTLSHSLLSSDSHSLLCCVTLIHSLLCCVTLVHSLSLILCVTLVHPVSFCVTLTHSLSFCILSIILCDADSLSIILCDADSLSVIRVTRIHSLSPRVQGNTWLCLQDLKKALIVERLFASWTHLFEPSTSFGVRMEGRSMDRGSG